MRKLVLIAVLAGACGPKPHPAPVIAPPAPVVVVAPVEPAGPEWPVPVRVLTWNENGGLERAGELPGMAKLPDEPWMAEPIVWPTDGETWRALLGELRAHDVPGLALRDHAIRAEVLAELGELPMLRYVDLSGAQGEVPLASLDMADGLTGLFLARVEAPAAALIAVLDRHPALEVLDLDGTAADDHVLAEVSRLPRLRTLTARETPITDTGGAQLSQVRTLRVVDLSRTGVGGATALALAGLPLTELYLARTKTSDDVANLAPIAPTLVRLDLSDLEVGDAAVKWLDVATQLVELNLGGTKVGDPTAKIIVRLPALRELDLAETRITAAGARLLATRVTLERVDLAATRTDDAAALVLLGLPALRVLRLDDTIVGDRGLAVPPPLALRELYLARTKVTDRGLALLDATPALLALGLRKTRITDATIDRIAHLTALTTLDVGEIDVSADRLASLAPLRALERLYLDKTRTGDATITALAGTRLRILHASDTMVSDASLDILAVMPLEELAVAETQLTAEITNRLESWPRLAILSLAGLPIRDDAVARLPTARNLRVLDLSATEVDDPAPLSGLARLEVLGLSQRMIGVAGVRSLARLPKLRELSLAQCGLGADVLPVLAAITSLRKVDLRWNPVTAGEARRGLPAHIELEK